MDLLTINETAEILRVSPLTVRRYISRHILHAVHVGRSVRIRREELERVTDRKNGVFSDLDKDSDWESTSEDDPLWRIVGIGESSGPTDVSVRKHDYLAEAYEDLHH